MKKKIICIISMSIALVLLFTIGVSAISWNGYINTYGTSGYAGTETSGEYPYTVSATLTCRDANGKSVGADSKTWLNYNALGERIYSYRVAEVYITATGTIATATSTHSVATATASGTLGTQYTPLILTDTN